MIKKWVIASVVYLLIVMAGFGIYNSTVGPKPVEQHQGDVKQDH